MTTGESYDHLGVPPWLRKLHMDDMKRGSTLATWRNTSSWPPQELCSTCKIEGHWEFDKNGINHGMWMGLTSQCTEFNRLHSSYDIWLCKKMGDLPRNYVRCREHVTMAEENCIQTVPSAWWELFISFDRYESIDSNSRYGFGWKLALSG